MDVEHAKCMPAGPQALMYPLLVACKSQSSFRRSAAMAVVDNVRTHAATLVEQAQLVRPIPVLEELTLHTKPLMWAWTS